MQIAYTVIKYSMMLPNIKKEASGLTKFSSHIFLNRIRQKFTQITNKTVGFVELLVFNASRE